MSPAPNAAAPNPRLLVVDDEPDLRTLYELTLLREGYDVECADTVEEGWALLQSRGPQGYQLVITDMRLPDGNGLDLLRRMDEAGRREKAIIITAYGSPENAVEALKAGAYDYLTKPVDLRQFRAVVASALGRLPHLPPSSGAGAAPAAAARAAAVPALGHPALARIVGESVAMEQVRAVVERVSRSMAPVLIQGESGTGKELVARAIHEVSPRAAAPFVAVNCGAIPDTLLEAEFFGYRKGAFTGAIADRDGFFQAAQGGTLFLDEIGDLPLPMQSKLLRVIQERAVRPIGSVQETPLNVRIVSATHRELGAEVQAGRFRQDLFYRLNVIRIDVPPLRERIVDLPDLCSAVLARIAADAGVTPPPTLLPDALQHLLRYSFPGNVRELENLLHRALALAPSSAIGRADLPLPDTVLQDGDPACGAEGAESEGPGSSFSPALVPTVVPTVVPSPAALPSDLAAYLDGVERDILQRALERHRYNRTAAGASLGLSLRQMRYRMARLGVGAADAERAESPPRGDAD
jgi:two-component system response regulator PilR (NtrC family)